MELVREISSGTWVIKEISRWLEERIRQTGSTLSTAHRSRPRIRRDNSGWRFLITAMTGSFPLVSAVWRAGGHRVLQHRTYFRSRRNGKNGDTDLSYDGAYLFVFRRKQWSSSKRRRRVLRISRAPLYWRETFTKLLRVAARKRSGI